MSPVLQTRRIILQWKYYTTVSPLTCHLHIHLRELLANKGSVEQIWAIRNHQERFVLPLWTICQKIKGQMLVLTGNLCVIELCQHLATSVTAHSPSEGLPARECNLFFFCVPWVMVSFHSSVLLQSQFLYLCHLFPLPHNRIDGLV